MSVDYKLLEELRDAGFPQKEGSIERVADGAPGDIAPYRWAYYPTLEELIEACGEDFILVENEGKQWCAQGGWDEHGDCRTPRHDAFGLSPTEAVARLWLALNKPQ